METLNQSIRRNYGGFSDKRTTILTAGALFLFVLFVFWPAAGFDFTYWDDARYVYQNPMVLGGFTWEGGQEAFRVSNDYWIPALWFSYMLDVEIFGPGPVGFHLTNILLHAFNSVLICLLFNYMTGRTSLSFLTALLFAVHPLRVESVAWVVGRKGLLSSFFLLLALLAYISFVRSRKPGWYVGLILAYALSLMAKPAMVMLPFLLLILDYWPLGRIPGRNSPESTTKPWVMPLVMEKVPLLLMGTGFALLTFITQTGARKPWEGHFSALMNLGRGSLSYLLYIRDLVWPADLGVKFYNLTVPPPSSWSMVTWILVLLVLTTVITLVGHKKYPYLVAGWFWYLVALFPISGIVPVGSQWTADRFTYVPHILLFAGLVWTADGFVKRPFQRKTAVVTALVLLTAWSLAARHQLVFWKDGITLANRSVSVNPGSIDARLLYADAIRIEDPERSIGIYQQILDDYPDSTVVNYNMAHALKGAGRVDEAARHLLEETKLNPDFPDAHFLLADHLFEAGNLEAAGDHYTEFTRIRPEGTAAAHAHNHLGLIYRSFGNDPEAAFQFKSAIKKAPHNAAYRYNLALTLARLGKNIEASKQYEESLRLDPGDHVTRIMYAEHLSNSGNRSRATAQYGKIIQVLPGTAEEHFAKGRLAEMEENNELALKEYRKGLDTKATYPEIVKGLERSVGRISEP